MRTWTFPMLVAGAVALPGASEGAIVTYVATGQVDVVLQRESLFAPELQGAAVGDLFELRITVDTGAGTDSNTSPGTGAFAMPAGSYSAEIRIGAATGSLQTGAPLSIVVNNDFQLPFDPPPPPFDNVEFNLGGGPAPGFFSPSSISMNVLFPSSAWGSDGIPTSVGAPLSSTLNSNFSYNSYFNYSGIRPSVIAGSIGTFQIIPAPATGALLVAGAVAAARRRRR